MGRLVPLSCFDKNTPRFARYCGAPEACHATEEASRISQKLISVQETIKITVLLLRDCFNRDAANI